MYGIPDDIAIGEEFDNIIDDLINGPLAEVAERRRNKCRRELIKLTLRLREEFLLFLPYTHENSPHVATRRESLAHVAEHAAALIEAINATTANGMYIQDYMSLQHELTLIQPPEKQFGFAFSELLGLDKEFHQNNPLYMVERDRTLIAQFDFKRSGLQQLLACLQNAAVTCYGQVPAKGGGPKVNHLKDYFVNECVKLFDQYRLKITGEAFADFVSTFYGLVTGKETSFARPIIEAREAHAKSLRLKRSAASNKTL